MAVDGVVGVIVDVDVGGFVFRLEVKDMVVVTG